MAVRHPSAGSSTTAAQALASVSRIAQLARDAAELCSSNASSLATLAKADLQTSHTSFESMARKLALAQGWIAPQASLDGVSLVKLDTLGGNPLHLAAQASNDRMTRAQAQLKHQEQSAQLSSLQSELSRLSSSQISTHASLDKANESLSLARDRFLPFSELHRSLSEALGEHPSPSDIDRYLSPRLLDGIFRPRVASLRSDYQSAISSGQDPFALYERFNQALRSITDIQAQHDTHKASIRRINSSIAKINANLSKPTAPSPYLDPGLPLDISSQLSKLSVTDLTSFLRKVTSSTPSSSLVEQAELSVRHRARFDFLSDRSNSLTTERASFKKLTSTLSDLSRKLGSAPSNTSLRMPFDAKALEDQLLSRLAQLRSLASGGISALATRLDTLHWPAFVAPAISADVALQMASSQMAGTAPTFSLSSSASGPLGSTSSPLDPSVSDVISDAVSIGIDVWNITHPIANPLDWLSRSISSPSIDLGPATDVATSWGEAAAPLADSAGSIASSASSALNRIDFGSVSDALSSASDWTDSLGDVASSLGDVASSLGEVAGDILGSIGDSIDF